MLARMLKLFEILPIVGPRLRKKRKRREMLKMLSEQDPYIYD